MHNQQIEEERWKPVEGYPNYEISSLGRVRSWQALFNKAGRPAEPKMLNPGYNFSGYRLVALQNGKHRRQKPVHRLVADAFCERGPSHVMIRHLDGNPTNNNATNLAWGTYAENSGDQETHGNRRHGRLVTNTKLTDDQVREIFANITDTCVELAIKYEVSTSLISDIRRRVVRISALGEGPKSVAAVGMGRRLKGAKLTIAQAREVFLAEGSQPAIGIRFGVSSTVVNKIKHRVDWAFATADLPDQPGYVYPKTSIDDQTGGLTGDRVKDIYLSRESGVEIAVRLNVLESTVSLIRNRKLAASFTKGLRPPRRDFGGKLDPEKAREIFKCKDSGTIIAERYGITPALVSMVKRGVTWRDATRSLWEPEPVASAGQ